MIKMWGIKRTNNNGTFLINVREWAGLYGTPFATCDINYANLICDDWNARWPRIGYYVAEYPYQIEQHNV